MNQQRTVVKKAIQTKKVYILKKRKWHDDHITCGFYRTREEMLNPYPQRIACFVQPYLVIVIWLQDISKTFEITALCSSRSVVAYYMSPRAVQKALFEASLESHCQQLSSFENSVIKE